MTTRTRWFEYGEPTGNGRVEATIRTVYYTGPNESINDDVVEGTIGLDALDMLEENDEVREHTHDDGSVMMSGLSTGTEMGLLDTFEEEDR